MWLINIIGFLSLNMLIAYGFSKRVLITLPLTTGLWILLLYFLAFFRKLNFIDEISIAIILGSALFFIKTHKVFVVNNGHDTIVMGIVFFTIFYFCRNRVVWNFDELGVWALETKSLFYHGGFAPKYQHVAIEYGDYNPGLMLFMWWFCHMTPSQVSEGMMYVGYWSLFAVFILPAFSSDKNVLNALVEAILICLIIFLSPSAVNVQNYSCITVELPMSSCFAYILWTGLNGTATASKDKKEKQYNVSAIAMGSSSLVMMKSSGFFFSCGLIVLFWMLSKREKADNRQFYLTIIPSVFASLSWSVYCSITERTTGLKLSLKDSFLSILSGNITDITDLEKAKTYIRSFLAAFIKKPLHHQSDAIINISPMAFVVSVIIFLLLAYFLHHIDRNRLKTLALSYVITIGFFSIVLVFLHIYMFNEPGYLQSSSMILTISRYGEPLFLGVLLSAIMVVIANKKKKWWNVAVEICICILLVISGRTADVKNNIIDPSYNNRTAEEKTNEVLNENADFFSLEKQNRALFLSNSLNDNDVNSYYDLRWIQYLSAPESVVLTMCTPEEREMVKAEYQEKYHYDICYESGF